MTRRRRPWARRGATAAASRAGRSDRGAAATDPKSVASLDPADPGVPTLERMRHGQGCHHRVTSGAGALLRTRHRSWCAARRASRARPRRPQKDRAVALDVKGYDSRAQRSAGSARSRRPDQRQVRLELQVDEVVEHRLHLHKARGRSRTERRLYLVVVPGDQVGTLLVERNSLIDELVRLHVGHVGVVGRVFADVRLAQVVELRELRFEALVDRQELLRLIRIELQRVQHDLGFLRAHVLAHELDFLIYVCLLARGRFGRRGGSRLRHRSRGGNQQNRCGESATGESMLH